MSSEATKKTLPKFTDVVVVGAGQAGIAASEHLRSHDIRHIVLEKYDVAESWRSRRWDSSVANGPAWHDKFPHRNFDGDQDAFVGKESVSTYMKKYANQINMPIFTGIEVTSVTPRKGEFGFYVRTADSQQIETRYVIAATGAFQIPVSPSLVPESVVPVQMHSMHYKNPQQLPKEGSVLVVGAGSSGAQIADESNGIGQRKVYLSVGAHDRPPRSYRGRDFCWWLGVSNKWDMETMPGADHTTIAVSGAKGGETIDFRRLSHEGIVLLGRTNSYNDGKLYIASDLLVNIARGDENYLSLSREADAYVEKHGLDLPLEPEAHALPTNPECLNCPIEELDLASANITSIIWATGFRNDYEWSKATNAVTHEGNPNHKRGVSAEPGIYFLGLPWQTRRGSSFIWGVWYDAKYVADHIKRQETYVAYLPGKKI